MGIWRWWKNADVKDKSLQMQSRFRRKIKKFFGNWCVSMYHWSCDKILKHFSLLILWWPCLFQFIVYCLLNDLMDAWCSLCPWGARGAPCRRARCHPVLCSQAAWLTARAGVTHCHNLLSPLRVSPGRGAVASAAGDHLSGRKELWQVWLKYVWDAIWMCDLVWKFTAIYANNDQNFLSGNKWRLDTDLLAWVKKLSAKWWIKGRPSFTLSTFLCGYSPSWWYFQLSSFLAIYCNAALAFDTAKKTLHCRKGLFYH